jgi:hypothetical protein
MVSKTFSILVGLWIALSTPLAHAVEARAQGRDPLTEPRRNVVVIEVHDDAIFEEAPRIGEILVCMDPETVTVINCMARHTKVYLGKFMELYFWVREGPGPTRYLKGVYDDKHQMYRILYER